MRDKVIVTGSSGLIGRLVCERLSSDFHVIGFDRPGEPHPPEEAEKVDVDLTSDDSVREALEGVKRRHGDRLASVVHLAAYYDFSGKPSDLYESVTVRGTERLLAGLAGFRTGQFIFSSTMLVHAPCRPGDRITEDRPLQPKWDYPRSKVRTEELILGKRGAMPAVLLRIAGVYDDDCHSIPLSQQMSRIHQKSLTSRLFPGDLSHGQPFLHLKDLVDAVDRAVRRRASLPPELVLLLGEPETLGYGELQKAFGRLIHGRDWTTFRIPKIAAKAGAWLQDRLPFFPDPFIKPWMIDIADDHFELDIGRARRALGWHPRHALRAALPGMVRRLKADPRAWYEENKIDPPRGLPPSGRSPEKAEPVGAAH